MKKNIQNLKEWYILKRRREFIETHDTEQAWNQIQSKINKRHRLTIWRRWGSIAAAVVLIGGAAIWWNNASDTTEEPLTASVEVTQRVSRHTANETIAKGERTLKVPMGAEYSKQMADGTKIVMNAGAEITYPDHFDGDRREVELKGEAYFEVAHNDKKPFLVSTLSGTIEVLGTHFNVLAEADQTTVTLSEGSVRLRFADREFIMKPGEQACMKRDGGFEISEVNTDNYTSWSTGTYEFTDVPLEDITRQLSLWYDVDIHITDPDLREERYTGVLLRSETLETAIHTLETISDIRMTVQGDAVLVSEQ